MSNQFNGLIVDDLAIKATENLERKLKKKIREIKRLESKNPEMLSPSEKEKIEKKHSILEQLNKTNIQHLYSKKETKKKISNHKSFKKMEQEQLEYKLKKEEQRKEKLKSHEEHWREKYRQYERYDSIPCNKEIKNACHVFKIKTNNITIDIVKSQYRKLALLYHPDKGGEHEDMIKLSKSYGILKKYLGL